MKNVLLPFHFLFKKLYLIGFRHYYDCNASLKFMVSEYFYCDIKRHYQLFCFYAVIFHLFSALNVFKN